MARPAILAIDQGTTNSKALLITLDGTLAGSGSVPTGAIYPQPGWAEQSAAAIIDATAGAITAARAAAPDAIPIAIAISNQRETVVAWDAASGAAIAPAILWQCRRSGDLCARLRTEGHEPRIRALSGLGLDPLFSAGKLRWLLDHAPSARDLLAAGRLRMGTVDSWLLWQLTGGAAHATDASNASRTQLLSLDSADWDADLLDLFGVPRDVLPQVRPSDSLFGHSCGGFAGLPDGVPIHAMLGDSHASLFAHGSAAPGTVKVTLGTGSSLMCPLDERRTSAFGLSSTIAWSAGGALVHALEGNIAVSGHAAAFGAEMLGLAGPEALTALAATVDHSDGVAFVPALAGMGAPHWDDGARGLICGLSLSTRPAHIARAVLDGMAHQICDVIAALEADLAAQLASVSIDGSAARNDLLAQTIADLSGRNVLRPSQTELSAIGAALMAAQALRTPIAPGLIGTGERFTPTLPDTRRDDLRGQWAKALTRAATR